MKKKNRSFWKALLLGLILLIGISGACSVQAAQESTETSQNTTNADGQWVEVKGKYYWKNADGTLRKKKGLFQVGKYSYYLKKDGSRVASAFQKVKGKYYYFKANGKMYLPASAKFVTVKKKTYYFYKDGHVATGRVKIGKKYYYFNTKGVLQKNQTAVSVGSKYYATDENGIMTKISSTRAQCYIEAQKFIDAHSKTGQSKAQKFRSCFNYLLAYMRYTPGYYRVSDDYKIIDQKEGVYKLALSTFTSSVLRGNCHRFAACIGVIAKTLGYSPTVIATTGDHSFVMINGGYYDNMYGGLFGASSRPAYTVYKSTAL